MKRKDREEFIRHLYWIEEKDITEAKKILYKEGFKTKDAMMSPCEALKASGRKVFIASPKVWSRSCIRQGSWYRESERYSEYIIMSEESLPKTFDKYLDAIIKESDFIPEGFPTNEELHRLVNSTCYQRNKPDEWERVRLRDRLGFKVVFTLTGFWKLGETLKDYWLTHKANHANFLCNYFTTEIEGVEVPYSISDNAGICSSCVEFFNVMSKDNGKLVLACPGSIMAGGLKREVYYYVKPVYSDT